MTSDSGRKRARLRYRVSVMLIRLLLSIPLAIGIAITVFGVRSDSLAVVLGGIFVIAIGFMLAGTRITGPADGDEGAHDRPASRHDRSAASANAPTAAAMPAAGVNGTQSRTGLRSVLRRIWPFALAVCWCAGMFLRQMLPLDHEETLYREAQLGSASWLMLLLPLLVIFWLCVGYKPPQRKRGVLDRSAGLGIGYVIGWIALMVPASFGATRLGYEVDKAGASGRVHELVVLRKWEVGGRWNLGGRSRIQSYYVSARLHGQLADLPVDRYMYEGLKAGDGISVVEVKGKSGRQYVTLVGSKPR